MAATNLVDRTSLNRFFTELRRLHSESLSAKGIYMKECRDRSERRKQILKSANAAGVPQKELRLLFKRYLKETEIVAIDAELEDSTVYEDMVKSAGEAGDLPLWAHAIEQVKNGGSSKRASARRAENSAAIDDIADDEFDRIGQDNADKLEAGIKPLN